MIRWSRLKNLNFATVFGTALITLLFLCLLVVQCFFLCLTAIQVLWELFWVALIAMDDQPQQPEEPATPSNEPICDIGQGSSRRLVYGDEPWSEL